MYNYNVLYKLHRKWYLLDYVFTIGLGLGIEHIKSMVMGRC